MDEQELRESLDEFGISRKERVMYSAELSRLIEKLNKTFDEEGLEKWNLITFVLEKTGKFKVDFEYVNLEESDVITRRELWKKKVSIINYSGHQILKRNSKNENL